MGRKVIYTVLTGGYDRLEQPLAVDKSWDYICFTDRDGRDGIWELRSIPFNGTPVLRARWAKLHPHILLPEYDYSVFLDANLCITDMEFYKACGVFNAVAMLEHPQRDCVWEELRYCYLKDKVSTCTAVSWYRYLKQIGMPRHFGLAETNILARAHNNPDVVEMDNLWWKLLLHSGGTRDQLAFTPALAQLGMKPALLFGYGLNSRNVPYVSYTNHPVTGPQNQPGKINWANLKYNIRLLWRKAVLLCLK